MKRKIERDPLRALDWQGAFGQAGEAVLAGAEAAFGRIRARERRRARARRAALSAACLALALGAGLWGLAARRSAPDRVSAAPAELAALELADEVFSGPDDPCFHLRADCPRAQGELAALRVETALEFEKAPCPLCCADRALPGAD